MRRASWVVLTFGVLVGTFLACSAAPAQDAKQPTGRGAVEQGRPIWPSMRVSLEVLIDGRAVPTIQHAGKTYLPVKKVGAEYALRVTNHGPRRIAAIVSVDGLSVINGQPATENHAGYLVDTNQSIVIKGWRRNTETVAAFSFQDRDQSYAERMGYPQNIGVIGLIAIEEAVPRPRPMMERKSGAANAFRSAPLRVPEGGIGTGYGRDVDSPIYYVPFVRSANRSFVTIYYDTVEALRAAGVPVDRPRPVPFPQDSEFAPPPPGDPRR